MVGYKPSQPIPFSHPQHVGKLGMDCRYCHTSVEKSAIASVPPLETCMGCHKNVLSQSPRLQTLKEHMEKNKLIEWVKVHNLPQHSRFDHSTHVNAGIGYESCHGRVDQMEQMQQAKPLGMKWCLDCHRNPEPYLKGKDKITKLGQNMLPTMQTNTKPSTHCGA